MNTIVDDGDLRKYRTEIPNMLDDSDLSVYAFRLYAHLKRVAGDTGKCYQGSRAIAKHCNMSPTSVVNAKHELLEKGFISIVAGDPNTSTPDTIRITNVWRENFATFTPRSNSEHPAPIASSPARVVDAPRSIGEHPARVVEHKKEPFKKEQEEERTTLSPRAREACQVFVEVYGHEPHTHGQEEIEAAAIDNPNLWRDVVRQCWANLTPAKNIGTMVKMYREALERGEANEKPTRPNSGKQKPTRAQTIGDRDYSWADRGERDEGGDVGANPRPLQTVERVTTPSRR